MRGEEEKGGMKRWRKCVELLAQSVSTFWKGVRGERVQRGYWSLAILSPPPSPTCDFFYIKYRLLCQRSWIRQSFSVLSSPDYPVVCGVNQLEEWLRDTSTCPHTHLHTRIHRHTQSHRLSLPLFLDLHCAASPTSGSEPLVPGGFRRHFGFFLSKNIPVGSPSRFVNLHLIGAPCWDAPVMV